MAPRKTSFQNSYIPIAPYQKFDLPSERSGDFQSEPKRRAEMEATAPRMRLRVSPLLVPSFAGMTEREALDYVRVGDNPSLFRRVFVSGDDLEAVAFFAEEIIAGDLRVLDVGDTPYHIAADIAQAAMRATYDGVIQKQNEAAKAKLDQEHAERRAVLDAQLSAQRSRLDAEFAGRGAPLSVAP